MAYKRALEYLYGLQKYGVKFGLSKTSNILKKMGNPHKGQKYIHIAGTNGKGSVSAMVESVLIRAGYKVGFYSSPHLVSFKERFRINCKEITKKQVTELTREIKSIINPSEPPTYFEFTTAMALTYFAREKTDFAILEVGMGGRLDATNIVRPIVSAITNISFEHQSFLGNTLDEIAGEKAGIIKRGVNIITAATQPAVKDVFSRISKERGAPLYQVGHDVRYRGSGRRFNYYGLKRNIRDINLSLRGLFQHRNATLALGILELLEKKGGRLDDDAIKRGIEETTWAGRVQVLSERPLIVVDGAHNSGAAKALARALKEDFIYNRLILVLGIMKDKDIDSIVKEIAPLAHHIICSAPIYYRSARPEELYSVVSAYSKNTETVEGLKPAIAKAKGMAKPDDMILITGSLFTVGEALAVIDPARYRPDGV
ncbi:MAG: bifunctional folylpolyglutamate synthase/dihydrofolate synthase [Deltaproteobacteria bacterium]|nr:bifunctional folylpolyglutamate synthase/dihydrofolate synthase [Deltaproteobacteria bacterium]